MPNDSDKWQQFLAAWMNRNAAVATRMLSDIRGRSDTTLIMAAFDLEKLANDIANETLPPAAPNLDDDIPF